MRTEKAEEENDQGEEGQVGEWRKRERNWGEKELRVVHQLSRRERARSIWGVGLTTVNTAFPCYNLLNSWLLDQVSRAEKRQIDG